jgi:hypothetical protein
MGGNAGPVTLGAAFRTTLASSERWILDYTLQGIRSFLTLD